MTLLSKETLSKLKNFTYHSVNESTANNMALLRGRYYELAYYILSTLPESREQSLALTYLEESSMRAIQCLAVYEGMQVLPTLQEEVS